jgi:hypothetical protein
LLCSYKENTLGFLTLLKPAKYRSRIAWAVEAQDGALRQPNCETKFKLMVKLQAVRRLGLTIPELVLVRVDDLIKWVTFVAVDDSAFGPVASLNGHGQTFHAAQRRLPTVAVW